MFPKHKIIFFHLFLPHFRQNLNCVAHAGLRLTILFLPQFFPNVEITGVYHHSLLILIFKNFIDHLSLTVPNAIKLSLTVCLLYDSFRIWCILLLYESCLLIHLSCTVLHFLSTSWFIFSGLLLLNLLSFCVAITTI